MKKLFLFVIAVSISGCAQYHHFTLIPTEGQVIGNGIGGIGNKFVSLSFRDKVYKGRYVYIDNAQDINNQSVNPIESTYLLKSAHGIINAISEDGDSIHCEFNYFENFGTGICMNNKGEKYDLLING